MAFLRTGVALPSATPGHTVMENCVNEANAIRQLLDSALPVTSVLQTPTNAMAGGIDVISTSGTGVAPQFLYGNFGFRISLPKKNQMLPTAYSGYVVEEAEVTYDGISYCVIAAQPEEPWGAADHTGAMRYDWHLQRLMDDFMFGILNRNPAYPVVRLVPSLLGFEVEIRVEPKEGHKGLEFEAASNSDGVVVSVTTPPLPFDTWALARLISLSILNASSSFFDAYQGLQRRDAAVIEMNTQLQAASASYSTLSGMNPLHFWRISRFGIVRSLRNSVGRALDLHSELSAINLRLTRDVDGFRDSIAENEVMGPAVPYFEDHRKEPAPHDTAALLESIRFYAEESRSFASLDVVILSTLVATGVSALVSIVIGIILS